MDLADLRVDLAEAVALGDGGNDGYEGWEWDKSSRVGNYKNGEIGLYGILYFLLNVASEGTSALSDVYSPILTGLKSEEGSTEESNGIIK